MSQLPTSLRLAISPNLARVFGLDLFSQQDTNATHRLSFIASFLPPLQLVGNSDQELHDVQRPWMRPLESFHYGVEDLNAWEFGLSGSIVLIDGNSTLVHPYLSACQDGSVLVTRL
nr:hypothetical protein CFP56_22122 [Quercus suber]